MIREHLVRWSMFLLGTFVLWGSRSTLAEELKIRPNIVYILADDLGWGDLKALNRDSKIATPALDKLASQGMLFSDAHSGSAVCTPTRYGILTGRYSWRTKLQNGVLGGYSPPLIAEETPTLPAFLKSNGYHTVCFGKWHLGMELALKEGGTAKGYGDQWKVDYAQPIKNGPTTRGFDRYFGISALLDMPPYIWIENDRTVGIPTVEKTWIRKGPAAAEFEAVDVLPMLTKKTVEFFEQQGAAKPRQPFFLYLPLASPHTPIEVAPEWRGKSGLNPYADFVMQTDDAVGQMLTALDHAGLAENTLVIFTSDNGCSPQAKYPKLLAKGHNPSGPWRGHKADIFEGGHRVPFLVRWPQKLEAGSVCGQTICLTDLWATAADIIGVKPPENAAVDSVSFLPYLQKAELVKPLREGTVHHSINGSFAIRHGDWKLCFCKDSGGWSDPTPKSTAAKKLTGYQLYNLKDDPGEKTNVIEKHPKIAEELTQLLGDTVKNGRSTPGPAQNDVEVSWRKSAE